MIEDTVEDSNWTKLYVVGVTAFTVALLVLMFLIYLLGWKTVFGKVLELSPPTLKTNDTIFLGYGLAPRRLNVDLKDQGAGLDRLSVEFGNRKNSYDLGAKESHHLEIVGFGKWFSDKSKFNLTLTLNDRSLFKNSYQMLLDYNVDNARPALKIIYHEPSVLQGSSSLIFIKASDNQARLEAGLIVGDKVFKAFPAKALDRVFDDPDLYVIPFVIPVDYNVSDSEIIIYVEDAVGNGFRETLNSLKIEPRIPVNNDNLKEQQALELLIPSLVNFSADKLANFFKMLGDEHPNFETFSSTDSGDGEILAQQKILYYQYLSLIEERGLLARNHLLSFDRRWYGAFEKPNGVLGIRFASSHSYEGKNDENLSFLYKGTTLRLPIDTPIVYAASDAQVLYSGNCEFIGNCVVLDHGLGLTTRYGFLDLTSLQVGDFVSQGQELGRASLRLEGGAFAYYYDSQIQGVPTEPKDWHSAEWFADHVIKPIREVKKVLGYRSQNQLGID